MPRWILLGLSLAALALGLLTTFKAPPWIDWRLAILAGEFGYWVALLPLAILVYEGCRRESSLAGTLTLAVAGLAAGLLLKPVVQAARLGRRLPAELESAFGPASMARPALSLVRLFAGGPPAATAETMAYSGDLSLDFYRAIGRTPAPCVIVLHSGGWNSGERGELPSFDRW